MSKVVHRTRNDRVRVYSPVGKLSRTKQSFRDECDINNILKKYLKTGILPVVTRVQQYGDFSEVSDYQGALHTVMSAQEAFMDLPSKVRERFMNDPGQFLEFMADPKNGKEAVELGLAVAVPDEKRGPSVAAKGAKLPVANSVPPVST